MSTAIVFEVDIAIAELLLEAGEFAATPYHRTPLDFVESWRPEQWFWLLYWSYWIGILKRLHIHFGPRNRPIDRIPDDNFPEPSQSSMVAVMTFCFIYSGCTISAWGFHFPLTLERNLWRAATITIPLTLGLFYGLDALVWRIWPVLNRRLSYQEGNQQVSTVHSSGNTRSLRTAVGNFFQKLAVQSDPDLSVPMKAALPLTLIAVFYCVTRAYVLIEDVVSLRSLPSTAYQTVQWSQFLPRIS